MSLEQVTGLKFGRGFDLGPFYSENTLLLTMRLNSVPSQFLTGHFLENVAKAVGKEQFSNDFIVEYTSKHFLGKTIDGYEWSWELWFKTERYLERVGKEINGAVVLIPKWNNESQRDGTKSAR